MEENSDLEDLESLFSKHFGTPLTTPAASQESEEDESEDDDTVDYDVDLPLNLDIDLRARRYVDETGERTDDGEERELCEAGQEDEDMMKIRKFIDEGCGCQLKCSNKIKDKEERVLTHILNMREMDKSEKDMCIMGSLVESSENENTKRGKRRIRSTVTYTYLDTKFCKKTFMLIYDIGKHSLQNIVSHLKTHGTIPRIHGNQGRKPKHSLKFEDIKAAIQFVVNYSEQHGIPQPAAPRGRDNDPPIYLPCDTVKKNVHEQYADQCALSGNRTLKYKTFCKVWKNCVSHIKVASPREDVCATCEKIRKDITDAVTEPEKIAAAEKLRNHNLDAVKERELYNQCIKKAVETSRCSTQYVHYTFDFSQNVSIPHHARQMGPLYFLIPRKIQIFGFRIDGIPRQLNFLIDENETIGKDGASSHGPDAVISMIHWALSEHGSGEQNCAIHADNCPGQNKNQYVLGYFMWRVLTGRHQQIEYMMQIPGHARCLVDGGFAHLKQRYRKSDCDTLDQLQHVVETSSITNEAVRYPAWTWRDWKPFLSAKFKPVRGVRQYQYFRFSAAEPGVVTMRKSRDADETKLNILKCGNINLMDLPQIVSPGGLSRERQQYLFKSVRPFVRPMFQDTTCPRPEEV